MTPSPFVLAKAERLLAASAVTVYRAQGGLRAIVCGDHGVYALRPSLHDWHCGCPSRNTCSHAEAVRRVTEAHGWVRAHRDACNESSPVWARLRLEADERIARYGRGEPV